MKVLFYSSYHATPHIETELEVAGKLLKEGHEVFFLRCLRQLNVCYANPDHTLVGCKVCISKITNAYKRINVPQNNIITFPEVNVDINSIFDIEKVATIHELKQLTYKGFDLGMAIASSLISSIRDHEPDLGYYKSFIQRAIKTAVFVFESASILIDELKPDVVYLFNGRFLEVRPFMRLCEIKSIKFYTHERGGILKNYLLRENGIPHSVALAKVEIENLWEKSSQDKEAVGRKFFEDRRNRVIQGWHSFTKDQIAKKLPADFNIERENITIFNSSMDEYEGIEEYKSKIYKNDNEAIEKIVAFFENDNSKHFYLRVHPNLKNLNNTQVRQIDAISNKYKNLTVIKANEDVDTYELMDNSNKIIVFGSTTGIEAVYWNKPVILLGRAFYESLNCTYNPSTHAQVVELINNPQLHLFNQYQALKYGYWCLNMGIPYQNYIPTAVRKGKFINKPVQPHFFWRLFYIMQNKLKHAKA